MSKFIVLTLLDDRFPEYSCRKIVRVEDISNVCDCDGASLVTWEPAADGTVIVSRVAEKFDAIAETLIYG